MKPKPSTAKPVKPRRMWAHDTYRSFGYTAVKGVGLNRPVLVIDLSPESVEALIARAAMSHTITDSAEDSTVKQLAAIGIKPAKGGRK